MMLTPALTPDYTKALTQELSVLEGITASSLAEP